MILALILPARLQKFKILVGGIAYPFIVDDFNISASTDLSLSDNQQKRLPASRAGNVMFYGSGAFGSNSYSSSGSIVKERIFVVRCARTVPGSTQLLARNAVPVKAPERMTTSTMCKRSTPKGCST